VMMSATSVVMGVAVFMICHRGIIILVASGVKRFIGLPCRDPSLHNVTKPRTNRAATVRE
jgi:hypothetical protein